MSGVDEEEIFESIHQYVKVHESHDPEIRSLCEKWMDICKNLDIDLQYVRCKMNDWFLEVYRSRNILQDRVENISTGRLQTRGDELYWKFLKDFDDLIDNDDKNDILPWMQMSAARNKIKEKYRSHPEDWVNRAVQCVQAEIDLLSTYTKVRLQSEQVKKAIQKVEQDIEKAGQIQLEINENLRHLRGKVSELRELFEKREEKQEHLTNYQFVSQSLTRQNGSIPNQQYFERQLEQINGKIGTVTDEVDTIHQQVLQGFNGLVNVLKDLITNLKSKVKEWQREFKFDYAELVASPNLDKIAPWCAKTGKIIHDVLHGSLVNWQNFLNSIELPNNILSPMLESCQSYSKFFRDMITEFIRSTFLVTDQGNFFIKTGNKRFPKFTVRVLAADLFSKHSEQTTAYFVAEEDLKLCCRGNDIDLSKLRKVERKLKSNKIKFSAENGKDKMECSFQNLQFEKSFKRSTKDSCKQVHEEKYRVVFTTTIESTACWTLSLPLVVTTASNQEVHSLASIMWQCYSTDVFSATSDIPEELPWSDVADMLQKKMARLSTKHRLSPENITHLKYRVFGKEDVPDDALLSLTHFCWSCMQDSEVSFWKWFLGVYNLIEQYLQPFWNDGLIMGFVKKEAAEKMLERYDKAGTFILRFSDKHFTNSDGRKSVYGRLTSCVIVMKDGKGNKRKDLSQLEPVKRKVVEHVDVADFKKLGGELKKQDTDEGPKNSLANILKETWIKGRDGQSQIQMYRYLYPSGKSREELFDKYYEEGCTTVAGYKHTREAYIAILEQAMTKVSLSEKVDASVSAGEDTNAQLGAASTKRPRRSRDNAESIKRSSRRSSSCQSNISTPQGSPFPVQSPQSHSQSPYHATQSPGPPSMSPSYPVRSPYPISSPAQSVPSPAFSAQMQTHNSIDLMVPCSDDKSRLPTFLTDDSISSGRIFSPPETCTTFSNKQLIDCFQTAENIVQGFDTMEVSSEINRTDQSFTNEIFTEEKNMEGGANHMILSESPMLMDEADLSIRGDSESLGGNRLMENPMVLIVTNDNGQYALSTGETENVSNISLQSNQPLDATRYQISGLTQAECQKVKQLLEEERKRAGLHGTQSTTTFDGACDMPVSTSSGSSGEIPGGFSAVQLAAMGSGDIDPNLLSIVDHDS